MNDVITPDLISGALLGAGILIAMGIWAWSGSREDQQDARVKIAEAQAKEAVKREREVTAQVALKAGVHPVTYRPFTPEPSIPGLQDHQPEPEEL